MKDVGVTLQSQLSVQDAAAVFQQTADDARGIKAKMIERSASRYGNDHLHGFFTPNDNSVFSAIDDDRPDFTVGVGIAKGNLMHGTRSGDGFYPDAVFEEIKSTFCFSEMTKDEFLEILLHITAGGKALNQYDEYKKVEVMPDGLHKINGRRNPAPPCPR